jgi:hypothetical protein
MKEVLSRQPRAHYLQFHLGMCVFSSMASTMYHKGDVEGIQFILSRLTSSIVQNKNISHEGQEHLSDPIEFAIYLLTNKLKYKCKISQDILF